MQTTIPPTFTGTLQGINSITAKEGWGGQVLLNAGKLLVTDRLAVSTKVYIHSGVVKFPTP